MLSALILTTVAGFLATAAGALLAWEPKNRARETSGLKLELAFAVAAGIMLAATFSSLLFPALERSGRVAEGYWGVLLVLGFLGIGFSLFLLMGHRHTVLPNADGLEVSLTGARRVALAMTIHNLPEGMAVGIAGGEGFLAGLPLALGIGVQNIPEGFAVAVIYYAARVQDASGGWRSWEKPVLVGAITGLAEPLGGTAGAIWVETTPVMEPLGLAFSAGAMLFVTLHDILPRVLNSKRQGSSLAAFLLGFLAMLALDELNLGEMIRPFS